MLTIQRQWITSCQRKKVSRKNSLVKEMFFSQDAKRFLPDNDPMIPKTRDDVDTRILYKGRAAESRRNVFVLFFSFFCLGSLEEPEGQKVTYRYLHEGSGTSHSTAIAAPIFPSKLQCRQTGRIKINLKEPSILWLAEKKKNKNILHVGGIPMTSQSLRTLGVTNGCKLLAVPCLREPRMRMHSAHNTAPRGLLMTSTRPGRGSQWLTRFMAYCRQFGTWGFSEFMFLRWPWWWVGLLIILTGWSRDNSQELCLPPFQLVISSDLHLKPLESLPAQWNGACYFEVALVSHASY